MRCLAYCRRSVSEYPLKPVWKSSIGGSEFGLSRVDWSGSRTRLKMLDARDGMVQSVIRRLTTYGRV